MAARRGHAARPEQPVSAEERPGSIGLLQAILANPERVRALDAALRLARPSRRAEIRSTHRQFALRDVFSAIVENRGRPALDFPLELAREFVDVFDALTQGYSHPLVRPASKPSGSRTWPALRRGQVAALAYIQCAKSGVISDPHPVKTVSEQFGVSRRLIRYWGKGLKNAANRLISENQVATSAVIRALMRNAARDYRRWRAVDERIQPGDTHPTRKFIGSAKADRK